MEKLNAKFVYLVSNFITGFILSIVFAANQLYRVQTVGLDPLQLVLVGTILEVTCFVFEIPTGVVADVYSRRLSVVIGVLMVVIALVPAVGRLGSKRFLAPVYMGVGRLKSALGTQLQKDAPGTLYVIGVLNGLLP